MKGTLFLFCVIALVFLSSLPNESEAVWGAIARGAAKVIGRKAGGSGLPRQHFQNYGSRKAAENAARNAGRGNKPVEHAPHGPGQKPHYHPADRNGNIIKDGSHHQYPNRQG